MSSVDVGTKAPDFTLPSGEGRDISLHDFGSLLLAISNPWVGLGIVFLLGFFASYMSALSWADLTYVLPASSLGYVLLAVIARFALHERVSLMRWLGIALVSSGVGFVTTVVPGARHGAGSTVIQYGAGRQDSAMTLKAAIPGAKLKEVPSLGSRLQIIVGPTWSGARPVKASAETSGGTPHQVNARTATQNLCK